MKLKINQTLCLPLIMALSIPSSVFAQLKHQIIVLDPAGTTLQVKSINPLSADDTGFVPNFGFKATTDKRTSSGNSTGKPAETPKQPTSINTPTVDKQTPASNSKIADVGSEYSCPLFENKPYQNLNAAIQNLSSVLTQIPDCKNEKETIASIEKNQTAISSSVDNLQKYMDPDIDLSTVDASSVSSNAQAAVQGIKNISDIFSNKYFVNSNCGKQALSSGSIITSLSDVVNNLAPFALMAASVNPAVSATVKMAMMGTIFASSTVGAMSNLISESLPSMETSEQRKAILQNVCSYSKVFKQVEFLTLAKSGRFDQITKSLNKNIDLYRLKASDPSDELLYLIQQRNLEERELPRIELNLKKIKRTFGDLAAQTQKQNDDMLMCMIGRGLVERKSTSDQLTMNLVSLLDNVKTYANGSSKFQIIGLSNSVQANEKEIFKLASSSNMKDVSSCAKVSKSLIESISQSIAISQQILISKRKQIESKYMSNPEYNLMKNNILAMQIEETTNSRLTKLLEDLAKDDSAIDRSELDMNMSNLQKSLFGNSRSFFNSSPVLAWINKTMSAHQQALNFVQDGYQNIHYNAARMTITGSGQINTIPGASSKDQQMLKDIKSIAKLEPFNLQSIPLGSRGHQMVCQDLKAVWKKWSASLDHLGATQFMCDMIEDIKDFTVERGINDFCNGRKNYNQANVKLDLLKKQHIPLSGLEQAKKQLLTPNNRLDGKSYQETANLIIGKINELKCALPDTKILGDAKGSLKPM